MSADSGAILSTLTPLPAVSANARVEPSVRRQIAKETMRVKHLTRLRTNRREMKRWAHRLVEAHGDQ